MLPMFNVPHELHWKWRVSRNRGGAGRKSRRLGSTGGTLEGRDSEVPLPTGFAAPSAAGQAKGGVEVLGRLAQSRSLTHDCDLRLGAPLLNRRGALPQMLGVGGLPSHRLPRVDSAN